jgi:hypothetical protein
MSGDKFSTRLIKKTKRSLETLNPFPVIRQLLFPRKSFKQRSKDLSKLASQTYLSTYLGEGEVSPFIRIQVNTKKGLTFGMTRP